MIVKEGNVHEVTARLKFSYVTRETTSKSIKLLNVRNVQNQTKLDPIYNDNALWREILQQMKNIYRRKTVKTISVFSQTDICMTRLYQHLNQGP